MTHRTEWEGLDHVEHCLDDFTTKDLTKYFRVFDASSCSNCFEEHLKLFNSSDPCYSNFSDLSTTLVLILLFILLKRWISLLEDNQAIVAKIPEMNFKGLKELIFLISEEVLLLLDELSDNVCEQAKSIW